MTATPAPRPREIAAFLLVALIWGSTWLVIKDQVGFAPPGWSVAFRFGFGAAGMFALCLAQRQPLRPTLAMLRFSAVVALCLFVANFQMIYASERYLTSGVVAVLFALLLVPNALLSRLFLGTLLDPRFLTGSALAMGGIALLMLNEYRLAPQQGNVPLGFALVIGGMLCASVANVLQATKQGRALAILPMLGWAMLIAATVDALLAALTLGPPPLGLPLRYWLGAAYLGLVGSVTAFPLYFMLIRRWGAGRAAYNGVLVPVIAMALSTVFENYRWTGLAVAGAILAVGGMMTALSAKSAPRPSLNEG